MSFDGAVERANIKAHLDGAAEGGVHYGVDDADSLPRWEDGSVKPYIVLKFARPIASGKDRGAGVSERDQPHILPFAAGYFAADVETAMLGADEVLDRLLGFVPNPGNSTELKAIGGGYSYTQRDSMSRPTRFEEGSFFECVINLRTGD